MLTQTHIDTVKATIPLLASGGTAITEHFYARMFLHNPELKNIFNMTHQKTGRQPAALFNAIAAYAANIDQLELLTDSVMRIAHKHTSFNIQPEQYAIVGHHLIETLRELAPDAFTPDVEEAWTAAYGQLADIFIKVESELYQQRAAVKGGWSGFRAFSVVSKETESELVTSFTLMPVDGGSVIDYKPGQYLGIKVHPHGSEHDEIRQYSLSTAANGKTYRISVKREGLGEMCGVMSNYLHLKINVGDEVLVMPPAGDFYLKQLDTPVILISAGVGLTPMQAMLDSLVKENFAHPVTYLHACKNRKQHSFKGHVESVKNTLNLQSHTWYENDVSSSQNETTGRMKIEDVKGSLPLKEGEFYLCGPLQFMLTIKQELLALGVSQSRINYELFGPHQEV